MPRRPGLKWGDTRIAFTLVEKRVHEALRAGRSVKSIYDELKPIFPGSYSMFARYVRGAAARTKVRKVTARAAPSDATSTPTGAVQKKDGPLELTLGPPNRFKHNPDPDSWEGLI